MSTNAGVWAVVALVGTGLAYGLFLDSEVLSWGWPLWLRFTLTVAFFWYLLTIAYREGREAGRKVGLDKR